MVRLFSNVEDRVKINRPGKKENQKERRDSGMPSRKMKTKEWKAWKKAIEKRKRPAKVPEAAVRGGGGGGWKGGGNESKAGCVAKKVATRSGDDHISSGDNCVGRAGQSKRCCTVCGSRSHSGHVSSSALPMRC